MKQNLLTVIIFSISVILQAQPIKSFTCTAGNLCNLLTIDGKLVVTDLTLTGEMDARDFKTIRDSLPVLSALDISGITIKEYSGIDGTHNSFYSYPGNTIPYEAFKLNYVIKSVKLPTSITSIGVSAFWYSRITSISIPTSVTNIGDSAFCTSEIASADLPVSITTIGTSVFEYCYKLSTIVIPSSVTIIGERAFRYCTILTLDIPNSVKSIGNRAFEYCTNLQNIIIPSSVDTIGVWSFWGCTNTNTITIPSSVKSIGDGAFVSCRGLIDVDENNPNYSSLDGILYNKSFTKLIQCPTMKSGDLTILNSVDTIGNYAFFECKNLTSVTIPISVTTINHHAFTYSKIKTFQLPPSIISIGEYAFGVSDINSVNIPASVISIGSNAFFYCDKLTSIIAENPVPIDLTPNPDVFYHINSGCILHVPAGSELAYRGANQWSNFGIIDDGVVGVNTTSTAILKILVSEGKLYIYNIKFGETLSIFNFNGIEIYKKQIFSNSISITLPHSGMYILSIGSKRTKIGITK